MSDTRKSVVVDIISDSRKFLEGFEESIKEIEKAAKKANILGSMQDDIDELRQSIIDVSKIVSNIKPTTDDSAIQKLQDRMETLDNSVKYLQRNIKEIKFDVNESSGKNLEKQTDSIKNEVKDLIDQVREASGFITELFHVKTNNTSNAISQTNAELEKYQKKLQELQDIQKQLEAKDTTIYSKMKFKEAEEELSRYKDRYTDLSLEIDRLTQKIQSGDLQDTEKGLAVRELNNYKIELASVSREIIDIQDRLTESKTFKGEFFDVTELNNNIKAVEKLLTNRIAAINNKIAELSQSASSSISTSTFELKDGKIQIPVELDKTAAKLKNVLRNIIDELQTSVNPVTVPIQLVSAYKTNTKKEVADLKEIQALQSGIDQLTDENQKSIAQSTLDKIKSQFQRELKIDIKTNITETEKDINRGISAIKKILKDEKIIIYPEIQLAEKDKTRLKEDIEKISKNFKIDFPISDWEKSIKSLTDESLIKNWGNVFSSVIEEACNRIDKTVSQLQTSTTDLFKNASNKSQVNVPASNINIKELKDILAALQRMSKTMSTLGTKKITFNLDNKVLQKTNDTLAQTYALLNKIFDVSGLSGLEKQFDNLRKNFQSISQEDGSFDARKKELKELISEYQKYLEMGGKQPISDLTKNEKSQKKLIELIDKQIQKQKELQNATDTTISSDQGQGSLSGLTTQLDSVIKIINEKSEAFRQEGQIVDSVVLEEVEKIEKLVLALESVKHVLEEISTSVKGFDLSNLSNLGQINKIKPDKINTIASSISALAEGINGLSLKDGNIIDSLQDILSKSNELKDLATALKATASQINAVKGNTKTQSAQKLLTGSEDIIRDFGVQTLQEQDLSVLSTSLKATSKGTIELIALVQDLNGVFKEYSLSTSDGVDFTTLKIEEGTNSVEKQALTWTKLHDIIATSSTASDMEFIDETSQLWKEVSQAAEGYKKELGEIISITRSVRQNKEGEALESFKITGASGNSVTIGAELEKVALRQGVKGADNQVTRHNEELIKSYKELIDSVETYYALREKRADGSISDLESKHLDEIIEKWDKAIKKQDEYEVQSNGSKSIENKANRTQEEFIKSNASIYRTMVDDYINQTIKQLSTLNTSEFTKGFNEQIELAKTFLNEMSKKLPQLSLDVVSEDEIQKVSKLKEYIEELFVLMNSDTNKIAPDTSIYKLQGKIIKDLENTAMPKNLKKNFQELLETIESMGTAISKSELKGFAADFQRLDTEMKKTGKTGKSFFDLVTNKARHASAQLVAYYFSLQDWIRYARQGFETIKEYDTALTEMNKVSDENISTLKEFQRESFELADAIGTTAKQIQNSTADWMRLGESIEEAKQSAQDTTILFNVSEFESIDEATEALVSMSQAYKDLDKMEIVDVVNNLGNNFAISTDGLATALQASASSLTTAKNDFYEAAALTTAANTVVQDPDKVGAGLRTIALRLTGTEAAREELAALGEDVDDFVVTTTSKLDQKIKDLTKTQGNFGVSLLDMNGNYRSTYEVLLDIAKVWDQIAEEDLASGENRQNALLEMMAGKNRSNILASVLQSPEVLEEAYAAALDSEGSALKENEAYLESIAGHLNLLKNAWDSLWINDNNREVITFFLDLAKVVLEVVNGFGGMKTLLIGGGGIFAAFKLFKSDGRLKKSSLIFV